MHPTQASSTFLIKMFITFLERTEPAQSMAKPACIKNTRNALMSMYAWSRPFPTSAASPPQMEATARREKGEATKRSWR